MKLSSLLLLVLFSTAVQAKNYYIANSGCDLRTGLTPAEAWLTIDKLNASLNLIAPGDSVLFRRGDTFTGSLIVRQSGTLSLPIVVSAYGIGARPVISGFTTLTGWVNTGVNIWRSNGSKLKNDVNIFTINGKPYAVGRTPNDSFFVYQSATTTQLTSSSLAGPNYNGAQIVMRKSNYVGEKARITAHTGSKVNYIMTKTIDNGRHLTPNVGSLNYGFFLQRFAGSLDRFGEWFMDSVSHTMMLYSETDPSAYLIKASYIDTVLNLGNSANIIVNNLAFEGGGFYGAYTLGGSNVSITNCSFNNNTRSVFVWNTYNILVDSCTINNSFCGAIFVSNNQTKKTSITNNNITNTGLLFGMGLFWSDANLKAIVATTDTTTADNFLKIVGNNVINTGHAGIEFQGSNVLVRRNLVDTFCSLLADNGGIYTFLNNTEISHLDYTNRVLDSNFILNSKGAPIGANNTVDVSGYYMDDQSNHIIGLHNTIANIRGNGVQMNNPSAQSFIYNTIYNCDNLFEISKKPYSFIANIVIKNNVLYQKDSTQFNFFHINYNLQLPSPITITESLTSLWHMDSNYISNMKVKGYGYYYSTNGTTNVFPPALTLNQWQHTYYHDQNSILTPAAALPTTTRMEYNATSVVKTVALDGKYYGVDSTIYRNYVIIQPYTSVILIKARVNPNPIASAAIAPAINCFGSSTTVTVSASGGTAPYTGTGTFNVTAGRGSLKVSASAPVAGDSTYIYSSVGPIIHTKSYVLKFSTLGTTDNDTLTVYLRKTTQPYTTLTPVVSKAFGTSRVDHSIVFSAVVADTASFLIRLSQGSGTTYIDNIAFFEAGPTGTPIGNNLYPNGQFESDISAITTWSPHSNQTAEWDTTSKINNIYYYLVTDLDGDSSVASVAVMQSASALKATATAGTISTHGGSTTVTITATGGTAPYTGTGISTVRAGTYYYTIQDARGCSVAASVTVTQPDSVLIASVSATKINCFGNSASVTVSATGGAAPYTGTGNYTVNSGTGALKLSFPVVNSRLYGFVYSAVGSVSNIKTYVLNFTTLGTTPNGSLRASLRQTNTPYASITSAQYKTYSTTRVDHHFIFNAPATEANASFLIEVLQSSGTTYLDNIAFFEADSTGRLVSGNLYGSGQFESGINGITIYTSNNNMTASWDVTSQINNTYYYPVTDSKGFVNTSVVTTSQPAAPLEATSTTNNSTGTPGTTIVIVSASGGTAPYMGTGSYSVRTGSSYSYTVGDANGCTSVTSGNTSSQSSLPVTVFAFGVVTNPGAVVTIAGAMALTPLADKNAAVETETLNTGIYPNPAITEFNLVVKGGTADIVNILVQSIDGKVLYQTKGNSNNHYFFGKNFVPGTYFVKITQGNTMQVLRAIKGKY